MPPPCLVCTEVASLVDTEWGIKKRFNHNTLKRRRKRMKNAKKKQLEQKGWKVGTVAEFLQLSPEESAYIEMKLALSKNLQERRKDRSLTQEQLARLLKSSQSRVAKMEAGDPSVSLDLLVRSLLILGESRKSLAKILSEPRSAFLS